MKEFFVEFVCDGGEICNGFDLLCIVWVIKIFDLVCVYGIEVFDFEDELVYMLVG